MVCFSNVNNKYEMAEETTFGTTPVSFTQLDFGQIKSINIDEEENMEKLSSINGGHTANLFEDGLYFANVTIETQCTKASLPNILKACLEGYSDDGTDYAVVSSIADYTSYTLRVSWESTERVVINGLAIKDFKITAAKGETVAVSLICNAKVCTKEVGTITATPNTDKIFKDLDVSVTVGGQSFVLNSFDIKGNWNVTDSEGRGIESVPVGERRLLQCFIRHMFDVSGSYEAEVDTNAEFGYTEERSDEIILFTLNRGTDNEHVFTMNNTRSGGRSMPITTDNSKKLISYDYEALDVSVSGDL